MLRISYDSSVICDQLDSSAQDEKVTKNLRMLGDRVSELLTLHSYLHVKESLSRGGTWTCSQSSVNTGHNSR